MSKITPVCQSLGPYQFFIVPELSWQENHHCISCTRKSGTDRRAKRKWTHESKGCVEVLNEHFIAVFSKGKDAAGTLAKDNVCPKN